jgi:hypothetical protein
LTHPQRLAVCLATLSVLLTVMSGLRREGRATLRIGLAAAVCLGLSVGAKLYAVVMGPWLLVVLARGMGWRRSLLCGSFFLATSAITLAPMFDPLPQRAVRKMSPASAEPLLPDEEALPETTTPDSLAGLKTFLRRWEMNDFVFLILLENLRVPDSAGTSPQPWFAITPESWRHGLVAQVQSVGNVEAAEASFLLARFVTLAIFVSLAFVLARRAAASDDPSVWLESAFLTLAWFWMLSPTQNPWYWSWALPLLPFDCRRSKLRDPRETKGADYHITSASAGPCCGTDGPCC